VGDLDRPQTWRHKWKRGVRVEMDHELMGAEDMDGGGAPKGNDNETRRNSEERKVLKGYTWLGRPVRTSRIIGTVFSRTLSSPFPLRPLTNEIPIWHSALPPFRFCKSDTTGESAQSAQETKELPSLKQACII
jgi:hypothetical protein